MVANGIASFVGLPSTSDESYLTIQMGSASTSLLTDFSWKDGPFLVSATEAMTWIEFAAA